jgi:hypothetical protein
MRVAGRDSRTFLSTVGLVVVCVDKEGLDRLQVYKLPARRKDRHDMGCYPAAWRRVCSIVSQYKRRNTQATQDSAERPKYAKGSRKSVWTRKLTENECVWL